MTKRLMGLFASAVLMSSGMALAHDKGDKEKQTQSQSGTGGSGQTDQMGQTGMSEQLGGNQLTGRVVKSDRKTVWVEHMGAIVPLKIDKNTQFNDPSIKRASDLREGDQIRASFEVRKTDNFATSIEKSTDTGRGGSGSDVMMPDQGINQQPTPLPPSPGTGGSGQDDRGGDVSPDPSLDTSGDVSKDQNRSAGDY